MNIAQVLSRADKTRCLAMTHALLPMMHAPTLPLEMVLMPVQLSNSVNSIAVTFRPALM